MQPEPEDLGFDLDTALNSVVQVRSEIPEDAFTARSSEPNGSATASSSATTGWSSPSATSLPRRECIWLTTNSGAVVAGYPLAYDQATGFGLVQPLGHLDVPSLPRGSAATSMPAMMWS